MIIDSVSRVVNLRLDKLGRAVPARKFKWTGPGRSGPNFSWAGPGRSGPKFLRAGPGRFLPTFRDDFADIPPFF